MPDAFEDEIDSELGIDSEGQDKETLAKDSEVKKVVVKDGIPGKSTQHISSWVEIKTHSSQDAEILVRKLQNAAMSYPDLKIKSNGATVVAQIDPIRVEIPYINGVIKIASEHGVSSVAKKFQIVDA